MHQLRRFSVSVLWLALSAVLILPVSVAAQESVQWKEIEPGFEFTRYELGPPAVIRPEVYLLKFNPRRFSFHAYAAGQNTDVRTLTKRFGGIAGINANFFDERGNALGLVVSDGLVKQKLHKGGKVLTGVFAVKASGQAGIEHRDGFNPADALDAVQAGPRLVENGRPLKISSGEDSSRRSGIAITKNNEIILYATLLRFPGASLNDIQQMLVDPSLNVVHALNLDGGGSSQLFVESFASLQGETFISGGDAVPVGIVVKRKGQVQ